MRLLILIIYLFSYIAAGHEYKKNDITIDHPVLKLTHVEANVGAGYMNIINSSNNDIYLKNISSSISKRLEIHEIILENDIYKMRAVNKNLLIPKGEELTLKAKSYHAMFFDFQSKLIKDDFIDAKIHFNNNLIIPIQFKVIVGQSNHNH